MTAVYPSWDCPTQPGVYETGPAPLDCPVVREHMDAQRVEFRAAMARIAQAIHPDDTVPVDLEVVPHVTPTGDELHELGWALSVLLCSIGAFVLTASIVAGWL